MIKFPISTKLLPNEDYNKYLIKARDEFMQNYKNVEKTDPPNFENYENLRILGKGAFGIVVS